MENYDLIMLALLGAATLFGAYKGFAWQVTSLASLVVSYWVAFHFRDQVAPLVSAAPPWNMFSAMLILYSASSTVIWLLFQMMAGVIDKLRLKDVDRQLGALLGFAKGVLFCAIVTFFAVTLLGESSRQAIVHSKSGLKIAKLLNEADAVMPSEVKTVLEPYLRDFDRQFDPNDHVADDDAARSSDEIRSGQASSGNSPPSAARAAWERLEKGIEQTVQQGVEDGIRSGVDRGNQQLEGVFRDSADAARRDAPPRR